MDERQALLAAIYAAPDDDLPRLVFADWLDENGEPERAAFIRLHIAGPIYPVPKDFAPLLEPIDRDAFELVSYRPTFTRGFLAGVTFPDFDAQQYDPPIYPVEEVADDWHRLCDLIQRNPLVNAVECPGWFSVRLARPKSEWVAALELGLAADCVACGGWGMAGGNTDCPVCDGAGTATRFLWTSRARVSLADSVLRHVTSRLLFGQDHPLFRNE